MLETEISLPIFTCSVGLKLYCSEHLGFCGNCGRGTCFEHIQSCIVGGADDPICSNCQITCAACNSPVCHDHFWTCDHCEDKFCDNEVSKACEVCQKPVFADHVTDFLHTCAECSKFKCSEHSAACDACGKPYCLDHLNKCRKCESLVYPTDARVKVKLKGENVVARCTVCS